MPPRRGITCTTHFWIVPCDTPGMPRARGAHLFLRIHLVLVLDPVPMETERMESDADASIQRVYPYHPYHPPELAILAPTSGFQLFSGYGRGSGRHPTRAWNALSSFSSRRGCSAFCVLPVASEATRDSPSPRLCSPFRSVASPLPIRCIVSSGSDRPSSMRYDSASES